MGLNLALHGFLNPSGKQPRFVSDCALYAGKLSKEDSRARGF